jgi:hypothetical protein
MTRSRRASTTACRWAASSVLSRSSVSDSRSLRSSQASRRSSAGSWVLCAVAEGASIREEHPLTDGFKSASLTRSAHLQDVVVVGPNHVRQRIEIRNRTVQFDEFNIGGIDGHRRQSVLLLKYLGEITFAGASFAVR